MSLEALKRRGAAAPRLALAVPALATLMLATLTGCSGQEPSLASTGDPEGAPTAQVESSTATEVDQGLVLPALVPAFGLGANTTECKFTDDPYSTCI